MSDPTPNFRMERIEKLLYELRYEVVRGMLEREIDETITFRFYVPISQAIPDGAVICEFSTRPIPKYGAGGVERLRLVTTTTGTAVEND